MENEILGTVRKFITENFLLAPSGRELGETDSFLENGTIDSTGVLELVSFLEEKFGIVVEDEELIPENLDSLGNVARYIQRKKNLSLDRREIGGPMVSRAGF